MIKKLSRTNLILLAALALQIVLIVVVFLPRMATSAAGSKTLFEGVKAEEIVRVTLREGQGAQLQIVKQGNQWVMPDADDFAITETKGNELANKLAGLKASRVIAEAEISFKRLKVADDDYVRKIEFETAGGARHTFYMGTSPAWSAAHVRLEGQKQVYLVSGLSISDVDTSPTAWIKTQLISTPTDQVRAITIQNAKGTLEMSRNDAGAWIVKDVPEGEPLDEGQVATLVMRVSSVYMQRPLGKQPKPEYGLDQPAAIVKVQKKDAAGNVSSYEIKVGARSADGASYVLSTSESPYYVYVADYSVEEIVSWTAKDLLMLPTPTPEATPQSK